MISQGMGLAVVAGFGAVMLTASAVRRRAPGLDQFLVANRSVGTVVGAMSVASTWIWAPALFIAAQKAYQQGLPGLMWFTVPNVGCLVLFAFVASRIREVFPQGYTLPQYVATRFNARTHVAYLFCFLALQICSMGVQLIAGAALLNAMSGSSLHGRRGGSGCHLHVIFTDRRPQVLDSHRSVADGDHHRGDGRARSCSGNQRRRQ